jgi:simple sugar transport system ATP-binding protein
LAEGSEPGERAVPLLEARGLVKKYGNVQALDGASFSAYPGEVVALIGDNGAGKSTLVKTLSGVIRPDSGQILVEGSPVSFSSPLDARSHGIETVYQDLALAPDLDAAANLHLGREIYRWWPPLHVLNKTEMRRRAVAAFADLGAGGERAVRQAGHREHRHPAGGHHPGERELGVGAEEHLRL